MKLIIKLLKILGSLILLGLLLFGLLYVIYNKPLPEGQSGPAADELAQKMLKAIHNEAYQNTRFLEWSYAGGAHHYKWDKVNGRVEVRWDDHSVALNLNDPSKSLVNKVNSTLTAKESMALRKKAWDFFNNDSFWLVAPFKIFDKGTKRSLVQLDGGSEALLVTYSQGGSTPGDSYLWKINSSGLPKSFQMWVQISPIGGIEATWDDWEVMDSGAFLATSHKIGPITLDMGKVKAYN